MYYLLSSEWFFHRKKKTNLNNKHEILWLGNQQKKGAGDCVEWITNNKNAYLSTTIAANFQSLISSASSSAFLIRFVINSNSFNIKCRSLWLQVGWCSSTVFGRPKLNWITTTTTKIIKISEQKRIFFLFHSRQRDKEKLEEKIYLEPMAVCDELIPICRKSSSISSTLANNDFDERSFSSNSFIRLVNNIVFLVIFLPGRDILNNHGSHCINTAFI